MTMPTLTFKRKEARELYLRLYDDIAFDEKKMELMLLRGEFLARNERFVKDWRDLEKHKQEANYREKRKAFCQKWGVDDHGLFDLRREPSFIVKAYTGDSHFCTLKVDLRYSKRKIMKELKSKIDKWHSIYREDLKEGVVEKSETFNSVSGNIPSDLDDYAQYLKVWSLREEEKKSWSQIQKELDLNSVQTARNCYKAASKLIREGVPGFPTFPKD